MVRVMAKDLVRTRQHIKKFVVMKANIQAVSLKVQTLKSQDAMAQVGLHNVLFLFQTKHEFQAVKGVASAMKSMNMQLNLPSIQSIMKEFETQSEIMDVKESMMGETIDDAMAKPDDEEEMENVVSQVRFPFTAKMCI